MPMFLCKVHTFIILFMLNLSLCLYASLHAPLFHDVVLIPIFCDLILSSYPYSFYFRIKATFEPMLKIHAYTNTWERWEYVKYGKLDIIRYFG